MPTRAASTKATPSACTCFRLKRLTRRVTAVYDRALAAAGMRVTQYSLLAHARRMHGASISALAEALDMDRTTLTRNLKPLLDAGWVSVEASQHDARAREVRITPAGEAQWQAARVYWRRAQAEVSDTIGEPKLSELHALLDRYVMMFRPAAGNEGEL